MADYWTTPKTNWIDTDGIGYEDLNRIEANISANRDGNFRKVQGFGYTIDNTVVGEDGVVTIKPGSCYSNNGFPIRMNADHVKNLTAWAPGNGAAFGGMAAAVTVAAHTWYYAFVIMDPTNGATEIMFDDNAAGTNVVNGIYTEKRFIHAFKTGAAGGDGSFDIIEMFAVGDHVFINPKSMYPSTRGVSHAPASNAYNVVTLTQAPNGLALPARDVKAQLNIEADGGNVGIISDYNSLFTVPVNLYAAYPGVADAEFLGIADKVSGALASFDCDIMIASDNKINIAHYYTGGTGQLYIVVRGYHDDRKI